MDQHSYIDSEPVLDEFYHPNEDDFPEPSSTVADDISDLDISFETSTDFVPATVIRYGVCDFASAPPSEDAPKTYKNRRIPSTVPLAKLAEKPKAKKPQQPTVKKEPKPRKESKPTALKTAILTSRTEDAPASVPEDEELDEKVLEFLKSLKEKQDKLWKTNENKARSQRRLVFGLHESLKHLAAGNVHGVFLARNIDDELLVGPAASLYHKIRAECLERSVPLIPAATKKSLSKAASKHPYTSCIALLRLPGYEAKFSEIVYLWKRSDRFVSFHIDQPSLFA